MLAAMLVEELSALAGGCAERRIRSFGIDGRKDLPGRVGVTDGGVGVVDVNSGDAERSPGTKRPSPLGVAVLGSASSSSSEVEPS